MRIVLTMVGITLGLAIAAVAGVYGWQQFTKDAPVVIMATPPIDSAPPVPESKPTPPPLPKAESAAPPPSPVTVPKPPPKASTAPFIVPKPNAPLKNPLAPETRTDPAAAPRTVGEVSAEDTPIAIPETDSEQAVTAEKLAELQLGITQEQAETVMAAAGVVTPAESVAAYTPVGWTEVRWPNADGSYIAGLFNDVGMLVHVQPFNLAGAYDWMSTPHYAVPAWLNERLQANNMIVRVPAVDVVQPQEGTFQFRGGLVSAVGETLGTITGTYYTGEAAQGYSRAMEGSYQYVLPNEQTDANTFQFTE